MAPARVGQWIISYRYLYSHMPSILSKLFGLHRSTGLSRYEIIDQIARGGMSVVHRARDRETGGVVALKILREDSMEAAERLTKAYHKTEGEIAVSLRHDNVVRTFDFGWDKKRYYIAMEYVDGPDLKYLLTTHDPVVREHRLGIILQMASGLGYIHEQNLLHRDFCPKNILLGSNCMPKIIDLGLCIPRKRKRRWKWDRSGTPSYMAPEQVRGQPVDARADIYSFGLSMYEILAGKRAFRESRTREGKMQPHLNVLPPPPSQIDPTISPDLDKICMRTVAKNRDQRYQTMLELLAALRSAAAELQGKDGWDSPSIHV